MTSKISLILAGLTLAGMSLAAPAAALAENRLPAIPPASYSPEQKKAADDYLAARHTPLTVGPFIPMMHNPAALTAARQAGDYFRFHTTIGNSVTEWAAMITARDWNADYEWSVHAGSAEKEGVSKEMLNALVDGRRPEGMTPDQTLVYDFVTELLHNKQVSDVTYGRALGRFGDKGVIDLAGVVGYYTFLAMQLNLAQLPAIAGSTPLPRLPRAAH